MAAVGDVFVLGDIKDERNVKKRLKIRQRGPVIITNVCLYDIIKKSLQFSVSVSWI